MIVLKHVKLKQVGTVNALRVRYFFPVEGLGVEGLKPKCEGDGGCVGSAVRILFCPVNLCITHLERISPFIASLENSKL